MTYSAEVLADSPRGYWRQGDPSGTTMTDSSGNGLNGTYQNSPTLATAGLLLGDADTAVTYASASSQCALVTDDNSQDGLTTFTAEAIIKPTTVSSTPMIIGRDTTSGSGRVYQFRLNAGKLEFIRIIGTTVTAASSTTLSTGTTYHVAVVYNGTDLRLYINGVLDGTPPACTGSMGSSTTELVQIGARRSNTTGLLTNFFNGVIDEVAVYNTALSAARILAHYTAASTASATVAPPAATATATAPVPVIGASQTVAPPAATATATAVAPTVTADASVAPPAATATAMAPVPVIDVPGDQTVAAPTATATATAIAPSLTWDASVAAPAATATATAIAPVISGTASATVAPPVATATATAIAPFISTDSPDATIDAPTATATAMAHAPAVVGVYSSGTDTTNLSGGRIREATGAVTITRPVEAVPVSVGTRVDKALAYPTPTMVDGRPT